MSKSLTTTVTKASVVKAARKRFGCNVSFRTESKGGKVYLWYRRPGRIGWEGYGADTLAELLAKIEAKE